MEYFSLRRIQTQAATCIRVASPDYAPPSGFLNLLTVYSACALSALFHAESIHGIETFRGFPFSVAATAFTALCPLGPFQWKCSEKHLRTSGIVASEKSVLSEAVLPGFHRPILS
jgi:ABC-type transport system involved in cytochrome c biogenesis permease subunit